MSTNVKPNAIPCKYVCEGMSVQFWANSYAINYKQAYFMLVTRTRSYITRRSQDRTRNPIQTSTEQFARLSKSIKSVRKI